MKKIYQRPITLTHLMTTEGHILSGSKINGKTDRYSTTGNGDALTPTGKVDVYTGDGSVTQRAKDNDDDLWDE